MLTYILNHLIFSSGIPRICSQDYHLIVKRQRKPNMKLIVAPFPAQQRGTPEFFFQPSSQIPLTTASQP
ncbi:transposase, IS4 [Nostoc carneum NIES-2107]|nr:transposase, IS4 [Nostoc carneum NIES-2107]